MSGLSTTHPVTIRLVNQEIKFAALGVNYDLRVPNSIITFSPSTTTATTTFDTTTQTWITNVPSSGLAGNVFLAGLGFKVPTGGLPGGINPVTWQGVFQTDPGVSLNWKWAAAVYDNTKAPTPFPSGPSVDYTPVGVKPVDDNQASPFKNADHAGTPEYYKPYVIGGATEAGARTTPAPTAGPRASQPGRQGAEVMRGRRRGAARGPLPRRPTARGRRRNLLLTGRMERVP